MSDSGYSWGVTGNDTNTKGNTMTGFKVMGMADEGQCEHCGANCPKRRVAIMPVDVDGNHAGNVEFWGVICASKVRHGSKSAGNQSRIVADAERADADREYHARQRASRIVTAVPFTFRDNGCTVTTDKPKDAANRIYRMTNRPIVGSYFAENTDGHIVRVDGTDAADVQFYADRGFVQTTAAVAC